MAIVLVAAAGISLDSRAPSKPQNRSPTGWIRGGQPEPRFAASDLLRLAQDQLGSPRTHHWLRSLIRAGLLNSPQPHGLPGRRGGRAPGTWSQAERRLFGRVLAAMTQGDRRAELCNLIAHAWLQDPDLVPIGQLRRALRTFRDASRSRRTSRQTALQLAELLAGGPGMSPTARRRFIDAVEAALHGGAIDHDALTSPALDPEGVGPPSARGVLGPIALVATLSAWQASGKAVEELDEATFDAARILFLQTANRYARLRPHLENRPAITASDGRTPGQLSETPCAYLLLTLGLLKLTSQGVCPPPVS
jgi:hypothetical protein